MKQGIRSFFQNPKPLASLSLCCALFTSSTFAVPDIYNPQESFLNQVRNTTGRSNAEVEAAYLNQIIELTYTGPTACGGAPCSSVGDGRITLEQWKTLNGFTFANREKITSVKYYNSADLGLGRDMNCVDQSANTAQGASVLACYVSNHGSIGGGAEAAFAALASLESSTSTSNPPSSSGSSSGVLNLPSKPFATVAMEIRPTATKNKVRFFVFGADDKLVNLGGAPGIVLDSGTGHEQPAVCMNCHGGKFTAVDNVEKAHFLPFDFNSLEFPSPEARTDAISKINTLNQLIRNAEFETYKSTAFAANEGSPLRIVNYLNAEYLPAGSAVDAAFPVNDPPTPMKDTFVEPKFNTSANDQLLYKTVVRNYCRTCHLAVRNELKPADVAKHVCSPDSAMPHAEVNAKNLLSHMDEIAAIIYKVSGNKDTSCFNMPVLNDFQWSAAEGKTITTTPSMAIAPSAITPAQGGKGEQLKGFSVDFQSKRTLKLAATSISGSLFIEAPKVGAQYVKSINEITFLATPLPADGSVRILVNMFDAQGGLISSISSRTFANTIHPLVPASVTGSPFLKYTVNIPTLALLGSPTVHKVELSVLRIRKSDNTYNFSDAIELDDVSVVYGIPSDLMPSKLFAVEDFEDQLTTYNPGFTIVGAIDIRPEPIRGTVCSGARTTQTNKGFSVSGNIKVGRDAGRYSLVSNPVFCAGESGKVSVSVSDDGELADSQSFLSFDFVIDKQADGKTPVGILALPSLELPGAQSGDAIEIARHQGTLSETPSQFFGHVTLRTYHYFQPLEWTPLVNSGVSGAPIKGVALDNFTMWDSP